MDKQLAAIKTTRSKLVSTSRGLATLFLIIFVLYCAAHVAVFLYMALLPNGFSYLGPSTLAGTLPFIIPSISGGFTIFLLWRIFREIGRNASPFTPLRVRQIRALGFLFLATAICGFFITPGTDVGVIIHHKDLFVCHKGFLPSGLSNGRRACGRPCVKKALHLLLYWRVMTK